MWPKWQLRLLNKIWAAQPTVLLFTVTLCFSRVTEKPSWGCRFLLSVTESQLWLLSHKWVGICQLLRRSIRWYIRGGQGHCAW